MTGTTVGGSSAPPGPAGSRTPLAREPSNGGSGGGRLDRTLATVTSLGVPGLVVAAFVFIALFPGALTPHDVNECILARSLDGPSWQHPFGMDLFGCDYWTRTLYGARTSMLIGGMVIAGAILIATVLGAVAAWTGGIFDTVITRVADAVFSIPIVLSALVVFGVTDERTIWQVIGVLTMFAWPPMVRLVRGAVRERLDYEHVLAARAMGARPAYVLRRHVIPHSMRPVLVFAMPYMATIVSLEAVLSFVGAGLQLPTVSWGLMLARLGSQLRVSLRFAEAPHLILPGFVLSLLVWALVRSGERLRAARVPE